MRSGYPSSEMMTCAARSPIPGMVRNSLQLRGERVEHLLDPLVQTRDHGA